MYKFPCEVTNKGDEMEIKFTDKFIVDFEDVDYENGIPPTPLLIKNIP